MVAEEGAPRVSRRSRRPSPYFLVAFDFGYTLLAAVVLFGGLGWWLDGRVGTAPLFLIAGILLGLAVAFSSLLRRLNAMAKAEQAQADRDTPGDEARP